VRRTPRALPLIDRIEIRPVLSLLGERGLSTDRLLEQAHIPMPGAEHAGHLISARSILGFLSLAAREAEIANLGWRSAVGCQITQVGAWGAPVSRGRTLRESIAVFCELYCRGITFVEVGLSFERGIAWLWRRRDLSSRDPEAERQGEQFMLGAMVKVVRQVAGESWIPSAIRLDSASPDWLLQTPGLRHARLSLNHASMGIAVPLDLLDRRVAQPSRSLPCVGLTNRDPIDREDFVGSLQTALASIVSQAPLSIGLGAEIAGTTPRTLRRWLHHEGATWREVVDRVRFEKSAGLLLDSTRSIANVAYEVGYSDPAHFTRAFQRWTQESPSGYRRRRVHEELSH
jgi:AraC-like DNA-binding protein